MEINKILLIFILITIVVLIAYNFFKHESELNELQEQIYNVLNKIPQTSKNIVENVVNKSPPQLVDVVGNYDYNTLMDPLTEPKSRPPRYVIGPMIGNPNVNIPTRGYPDSYSLKGVLIAEIQNTSGAPNMIKLFGRQKYPNSYTYDYYYMINQHGEDFKFHLKHKNEIYDGDVILIPELNNKAYKAKMYSENVMEYNPYLI